MANRKTVLAGSALSHSPGLQKALPSLHGPASLMNYTEIVSMIPLVINADDFGLTEGVCSGIVRAIYSGGVTATTAMVCVPGAVERLRRWAPEIPGRIGAHLQLTSGKPVLLPELVSSLVGADGSFPSRRKDVQAPRTEEILSEWRAQIELLLSVGIQPTHLDSHHHIHSSPAAFPAFCEIAKQYGFPARSVDRAMTETLRDSGIPCVDATLIGWYGGELSAESLVKIVRQGVQEYLGAESFELMCHPGFSDNGLGHVSRYTSDRERELAALCDCTLQGQLAAAGFVMSSVSMALGAHSTVVGNGDLPEDLHSKG